MKSYLNKAMKDKYFLALLALFIVGIFLRFYKLEGFVTFLGDQGRDAIVIKRILLFEHFPAIGAPMSIGGVYLGPFYYYFIAPWLLLFNFNPIGLAFGVAFFSSLFILINYYIVKEFFDKKIALVSSFIICFSSLLIEFSRFSWNPNLLPLFSILFVYSFIKAVLEKKYIWFIFAGSVLALTIQLHYLALLLGVPTIIILIWEFVRDKSKKLSIILGTALMGLGFLFFSLPL
ncbi:MAG TPA: glycosyltransferase family 39 protein, partial [Candidatus Nitrosocosmicus sp.]|nr:glycosyltransferase family 39 protein [Candidatus Nitrosocosmicus sp.]